MTLTIAVLEAQWDALVEQRLLALNAAVGNALPQQGPAVIEHFNKARYFEDQFDALEEQIRELDPDHFLLAENQPYL